MRETAGRNGRREEETLKGSGKGGKGGKGSLEQLARSDIGEGAVPFSLGERGTEREGRNGRRGGEGDNEFQVWRRM